MIEIIAAADTRPLRHAVLRPGQPAERLVYPGDDDPASLHLGARGDDRTLVAVASFYDEPIPTPEDDDDARASPVLPGTPAHRIRGMATHPEHRGNGLGRRLVGHGLALLTERHGREPALWCNARTTACVYYEKLGFVRVGDEFEIKGIGPHFVMVRSL